MSLSDQLKNLEHLVSNAMGTALEDAERTLSNQIRKLSEALQQRAEEQAADRLHDAVARIDQCTDQSSALSALLEEAGHYSSRAILFLTFTDGIRGWASFGFGDQVEALEGLDLSADAAPFADFAEHPRPTPLDSEDCDPICQALDAEGADEGLLLPMVLRDRVAAALYADRLEPRDAFDPSALALLVHCTAQRIESQGLRSEGSPTLAAADEAPRLALWDPAAIAPAPTSAAAVPPVVVEEAYEFTEEDTSADLEAEAETETTVRLEAPTEEATALGLTEPPAVEDLTSDATTAEEPDADEPVSTEATVRISRQAMEAYIQSPQIEDISEPEDEGPEGPTAEFATVSEEEVEAPEEEGQEEEAESVAAEDLGVSDWVEPAPAPEVVEIEAAATDFPVEELEASGLEVTDLTMEEFEAGEVEEVADFDLDATDAMPQGTDTTEIDPVPPEAIEMPTVVEFDSPEGDADDEVEEDEVAGGEDEGDLSEEKTVLLDRSTLTTPTVEVEEESAPAAEAAPEPPSPPAPAPVTGGSTQVQPPADLEGPGWAFRQDEPEAPAGADPEDAAVHEEARRLARLLVSEIKLYNEEQVEDGRRNHDIYTRLQDDIDRSHQMYRDRVDARVGDVDYFREELVNILAGGDADALGM